MAAGRFEDAETPARTALKLRERIENDTPAVAADALALARVLAEKDYRAEANALYHRALTIYRAHGYQYDAAVCLHGLARLHADTEPAVSRERLMLALWIKRGILGGLHPEVLELLTEMSKGAAESCR